MYPSDAYKALYGISKSFYREISGFVNGLPVADFDRALLWFPESGTHGIERRETQGEVLPTWSWSCLRGYSDPAIYQGMDFYGTLVLWYHANCEVSSLGSIIAFNHDGTEPNDGWQVYMAIASKERCVEGVSLAFSLASDSFLTVRELVDTRWKDYESFCKEAFPFTIDVSEMPYGILTDGIKNGLITTRSQAVLLRIATKTSPVRTIDIINSEGDTIGELCGDADHLRKELTSLGYNAVVEFEFIALSLSGTPIRSYQRDKLGRKNYVDADGNSLEKVPIVNVLMIANSGGLAHRRELGWVYLRDWARLQREQKVVVLE
ncbi:Heterokaryon incompatibility [Penicillium antarcticum]|uniref:Heterokaryon incompatibility n=1 Tax=Penicillium antarcticum TaxID=416450 RepID=UPI00238873E4|nr:Heterokaryon incompatibility [Penicillium antarcticum]KAJ5305974.1 Heterokaryon incompatibility [Penicillium antarcticum]